MRLKHKVSIVTGAAQGIGLATALKFAAEGASVVVCDLRPEGVDAAVALVHASGAQAMGFALKSPTATPSWPATRPVASMAR